MKKFILVLLTSFLFAWSSSGATQPYGMQGGELLVCILALLASDSLCEYADSYGEFERHRNELRGRAKMGDVAAATELAKYYNEPSFIETLAETNPEAAAILPQVLQERQSLLEKSWKAYDGMEGMPLDKIPVQTEAHLISPSLIGRPSGNGGAQLSDENDVYQPH